MLEETADGNRLPYMYAVDVTSICMNIRSLAICDIMRS